MFVAATQQLVYISRFYVFVALSYTLNDSAAAFVRDLFITFFTVLDFILLMMDIAKSEAFKNFTILRFTVFNQIFL